LFKVKILENGKAPVKTHDGDAGFDVFTKDQVILKANTVNKIPLGFSVEFPKGLVMIVDDKSGIASKGRFTVGGIIDSTYRGEVHCVMINNTNEDITFEKHQKIAQVLLMPCYTRIEYTIVDELSDTDRGSGGFGSTGAF